MSQGSDDFSVNKDVANVVVESASSLSFEEEEEDAKHVLLYTGDQESGVSFALSDVDDDTVQQASDMVRSGQDASMTNNYLLSSFRKMLTMVEELSPTSSDALPVSEKNMTFKRGSGWCYKKEVCDSSPFWYTQICGN